MSVQPEIPVVPDTVTVQAIPESERTHIPSSNDVENASTVTVSPSNITEGVLPAEESSRSDIDNENILTYETCGKIMLWTGIALMWTVFELDHTTNYNYQNYAASDFGQISSLGALQTASTIVIAVMKPPIAKISDVMGKAETYCFVVLLYVISYILCATSPTFDQYVGGFVIYSVGATGMQILNQIIVADITSARWRGLANGLINLPFMIVPWCAAFIVESVLHTIGWRWGIGMFAIIMPVASLAIVVPLFIVRHRNKKHDHGKTRPTSVKGFLSAIDAVGVTILAIGCTMFLLPMALSGNAGGGWSRPWVPIVTILGVISLAIFGLYEVRYAQNPVMPARYWKSISLVLASTIGLLDAFAFQVTHTYMYAWATVSHDFSARDATFLTYTSGCFQVASGLLTGFLMFRTRRYKWLLIIGCCVRLVGYGVMIRLRGAVNSSAELFIVQAIQGLGSGMVGAVVIVVAQIVVARAELAQATSLILLAIFMGQAIGAAVAGAIYTGLFRGQLRVHLGTIAASNPQTIDDVFNSISSQLPAVGTLTRTAIDEAYSDVLRYMTIAALVASCVPFLVVWLLPNLRLNDEHNLAHEIDEEREKSRTERTTAAISTKPRTRSSIISQASTLAVTPLSNIKTHLRHVLGK